VSERLRDYSLRLYALRPAAEKGLMDMIFPDFIEDCQKIGIPVKDISKLDGTVPNFNPSSSPSGVDSQLARVPQCAWLVAVVFSTGVFGLFRL
jgi:hypothetical protein